MSTIGTGVAAGVAQTTHQAQQVARQRDRRAVQSAHDADRFIERADEHISVLDEADSEAPDQLRVTADSQRQQDQPQRDKTDRPDGGGPDAAGYDATGKPAAPGGLYRHVDYNA